MVDRKYSGESERMTTDPKYQKRRGTPRKGMSDPTPARKEALALSYARQAMYSAEQVISRLKFAQRLISQQCPILRMEGIICKFDCLVEAGPDSLPYKEIETALRHGQDVLTLLALEKRERGDVLGFVEEVLAEEE